MLRSNWPSSSVRFGVTKKLSGSSLGWYSAAGMYVFSFADLLAGFSPYSDVWQFYMCLFAASDAPCLVSGRYVYFVFERNCTSDEREVPAHMGRSRHHVPSCPWHMLLV
jgi:hypothetical protein